MYIAYPPFLLHRSARRVLSFHSSSTHAFGIYVISAVSLGPLGAMHRYVPRTPQRRFRLSSGPGQWGFPLAGQAGVRSQESGLRSWGGWSWAGGRVMFATLFSSQFFFPEVQQHRVVSTGYSVWNHGSTCLSTRESRYTVFFSSTAFVARCDIRGGTKAARPIDRQCVSIWMAGCIILAPSEWQAEYLVTNGSHALQNRTTNQQVSQARRERRSCERRTKVPSPGLSGLGT